MKSEVQYKNVRRRGRTKDRKVHSVPVLGSTVGGKEPTRNAGLAVSRASHRGKARSSSRAKAAASREVTRRAKRRMVAYSLMSLRAAKAILPIARDMAKAFGVKPPTILETWRTLDEITDRLV